MYASARFVGEGDSSCDMRKRALVVKARFSDPASTIKLFKGLEDTTESLILAQDERWRRA